MYSLVTYRYIIAAGLSLLQSLIIYQMIISMIIIFYHLLSRLSGHYLLALTLPLCRYLNCIDIAPTLILSILL